MKVLGEVRVTSDEFSGRAEWDIHSARKIRVGAVANREIVEFARAGWGANAP